MSDKIYIIMDDGNIFVSNKDDIKIKVNLSIPSFKGMLNIPSFKGKLSIPSFKGKLD